MLDVNNEPLVEQYEKSLCCVIEDADFPGCNAPPGWTDGHHIAHWVNGGSTTTSNGCLLCSRHHHYVHEGRWTITGNANGELLFTSPTGTVLHSQPPGLTTQAAA